MHINDDVSLYGSAKCCVGVCLCVCVCVCERGGEEGRGGKGYNKIIWFYH